MKQPQFLTLEKTIELGEYDPKVLRSFPEFKKLSRHSQFQLIRQALKNREHQLRIHWAEITNLLDFSKKPHLTKALAEVENQIEALNEDEEKLLIEYSKL